MNWKYSCLAVRMILFYWLRHRLFTKYDIMRSMGKIDISKYKEEDITNISKEETPIVKVLDRRQTASFLCGFVLFILCGVNAYFYNEIGRVPATVIAILLAVALIFCIVYSIKVSIQLSKIKRWQVNELYRRIRERGDNANEQKEETERSCSSTKAGKEDGHRHERREPEEGAHGFGIQNRTSHDR